MDPLRYTLLTDGASDRCLNRMVDWVLVNIPQVAARGFVAQYADPGQLGEVAGRGLAWKMRTATQLFPCDVLFVHRDAETRPRQDRVDEVGRAANEVELTCHIPVVPVRMTEAWLLIDERAIRTAAGNPNGTCVLTLPPLQVLEGVPNPKQMLRELLLQASELTGRRREKLKRVLPSRTHRVADLMEDFTPLRRLSAFAAFESETKRVIRTLQFG